jgi:hypothetical protein
VRPVSLRRQGESFFFLPLPPPPHPPPSLSLRVEESQVSARAATGAPTMRRNDGYLSARESALPATADNARR